MKIENFSEFCERWTENNIELCSCYHLENPPCSFCETSPYYQNKMIDEYDEYIKKVNQKLGRTLGDMVANAPHIRRFRTYEIFDDGSEELIDSVYATDTKSIRRDLIGAYWQVMSTAVAEDCFVMGIDDEIITEIDDEIITEIDELGNPEYGEKIKVRIIVDEGSD